jgi:hypothetical protein
MKPNMQDQAEIECLAFMRFMEKVLQPVRVLSPRIGFFIRGMK